ncbi:cytochrome P450 [Streptomyces tendae]|uniref:cytochrome P450 n=1 Tax=Streptomyces tendae TaxID=1932 RepID=UPI0036A5379D
MSGPESIPLEPADLDAQAEAALRALREHDAVVPVDLPEGLRVWVITRYQEGRKALTDPRFVKDMHRLQHPEDGFAGKRYAEDILAVEGRHMLNSDGAEHTRLRSAVASYFTAQASAGHEREIRQIAATLAENVASQERVDLMSTYAQPLPELVIGRIIGVPDDTMPVIGRLSRQLSSRDNPATAPMRRAYSDLVDLVRDLTAHPPTDDAQTVISGLQKAVVRGDLSRREAASTLMLLFAAGISTTATGLGHAAATLMCTHAVLRPLLGSASAASLVDEILRHHPPIQFASWRFVPVDVPVGSTTIPAGSLVLVLLASANRDPAAFPAADELVPDRQAPPAPLTFGRGPHYCIGVHLARLEIRIGLQTLFERLPDLQLINPHQHTTWRGLLLDRTITSLPVITQTIP